MGLFPRIAHVGPAPGYALNFCMSLGHQVYHDLGEIETCLVFVTFLRQVVGNCAVARAQVQNLRIAGGWVGGEEVSCEEGFEGGVGAEPFVRGLWAGRGGVARVPVFGGGEGAAFFVDAHGR